jgi:hypothetical protein
VSNDVNVITLTRFRADLARSLSRRADKLIEAPNLREQVQALEPLEAYFIVKEVGLESALPILKAATPEQLQAFVDLDCWVNDAPDAAELDSWLAAFASDGQETLATAYLSLDEELQVWFLTETLRVYEAHGDEPIPDPPRGARRMNTPDRMFVIEVASKFEGELDPLALIDALYRRDIEESYRLLVASRWELESTLTEEALRFRSGRVADLGFPPRDEAVKLFAPPPAKPRAPSIAQHPVTQTLPALYAAPLLDKSLLSRALGRIDDEALIGQLERDFMNLVNLAVVAYGETPRDVAHIGDITTRVRDTVSLGIESLMTVVADNDSDDDRAAALVRTWSLTDLFRQGHQQSVALQRSAGTLAADPVVKAWLDKTESEADDYSQDKQDRAFVRGLLQIPPLLVSPDPLKTTASRAFASKNDIDSARTRLEAIRERVT